MGKRNSVSIKLIVAIAIFVLFFSTSGIRTFAAANTIWYSGTYVDLLNPGSCANRNVSVYCYNTNSLQHNDIRMLDSSGNVVWEEYGAIDYSGSRTFWCGSNVYRIQIRVSGKNIVGDLMPKNGVCNVI